MYTAKNFSFDGQPIEFILEVQYIVLVDPMALQGVCDYLDQTKLSEPIEIAAKLQEYTGLRVGTSEIKGFRSGVYRLFASDLQACNYDDLSRNVCEVDSAFIMIVGIDKLQTVSKVFTWKRFDAALRSPAGDDSKFIEFVSELGGPFFGLISSVDGTNFKGDGRYKLKEGTPVKLTAE